MKIEHVALNVPDAEKTAEWYVEHLGMKLIREGPQYGMRFVADSAGTGVLEFYTNPDAPIPDYASMNPLVLHIAFSVEDVDAAIERLVGAGATEAGEVMRLDNGDVLGMIRDPWGVCIQLAKRGTPLL